MDKRSTNLLFKYFRSNAIIAQIILVLKFWTLRIQGRFELKIAALDENDDVLRSDEKLIRFILVIGSIWLGWTFLNLFQTSLN